MYLVCTMQTTNKQSLHTLINTRGLYEQENAFLFATLYNTGHRLCKRERGLWKQVEKRLRRKSPNFRF